MQKNAFTEEIICILLLITVDPLNVIDNYELLEPFLPYKLMRAIIPSKCFYVVSEIQYSLFENERNGSYWNLNTIVA